jgi:hypothetical protein
MKSYYKMSYGFRMMIGKISSIILMILASLTSYAQSIDDLGVVWSKTYGQGNILNIKHNAGGTYTACGWPWQDGVSTKLERLTGLVIEFDESGNELRRATASIPQSYINTHPGDSIANDAYARFNVAFKTPDGGFLAFGSLSNKGAPLDEKEYSWNSGDFINSQYSTNSVWIVKFNSDLSIASNTLVRGREIVDGWLTSTGTYFIGGFDASETRLNPFDGKGMTLLREYDQSGALLQDKQDTKSQVTGVYQYPDGSYIVAAGSRFFRVSSSLVVGNAIGLKNLVPGAEPWLRSISPSSDGGIFIGYHLDVDALNVVNSYTSGSGTYKLNSSNAVVYGKTWIPADTIFQAPLLLPGSTNKYIGTATLYNTSGGIINYRIYELTDNGTSFAYRTGDYYPSGTSLKTVSQTDGFFSCGRSSGQAAIAKLSTCAKFMFVNPATNSDVVSGAQIPVHDIQSTGYIGTVSYQWSITDVTSGGAAVDITGISNPSTPKTTNTIPAHTLTLQSGKTYGELRYTITITDTYSAAGGGTQSCQQTQTAIVKVYPPLFAGTITPVCGATTTIISTADASGCNGVITYKWQKYNGTAWEDINGETGKDYSPPATTPATATTTHYRRVAMSSCEHAYAFATVTEFNGFDPNGNYPDNISNATCFTTPPQTTWSITESSNLGVVSTYSPSYVGDLDGDGLPEIVTIGNHDKSDNLIGITDHYSTEIAVFKNNGNGNFMRTDITTTHHFCPFSPGNIAIARVPIGGVLTGIVVVAEADLILRAYNASTGALIWSSKSNDGGTDEYWYNISTLPTTPAGGNRTGYGTSIGFADFNNDGVPEIYAGNDIFNAATGRLLCSGGNNSNKGFSFYAFETGDIPAKGRKNMSIAADVLGDSKLELVAGGKVYDVNIPLGSTGAGTMTITSTSPSFTSGGTTVPAGYDGFTQIIDINNDGKLDVVVERWMVAEDANSINYNTAKKVIVYVWTPDVGTGTVLASRLLSNNRVVGVPFIGDIDGDKKPEVLFITNLDHNALNTGEEKIYALKYTANSTPDDAFTTFWTLSHSDYSGVTGLTLFDFNQDGKSEIVYRDQTHLRIIDGSQSAIQPNLDVYSCRSSTGYEYPVIADIDNDGAAEIIIAGDETGGDGITGKLRVFKSGGSKWAPARKVWNQYAYNVVNVNEDLTIPPYQFNISTIFPGANGVLNCGDNDDIRPFNNFLQQQTSLSINGTPLWVLPDAEFADAPVLNYNTVTNTLVINMQIKNSGDAVLVAPYYVSAYKNSITPANKLETVTAFVSVNPDETKTVNLTVNNFNLTGITKIIIRINNNNGNGDYIQPECITTNNDSETNTSSMPVAYNDTITTLMNTAVTIPVKTNDVIPVGCTENPAIEVNPKNHKTVAISGENVVYTPQDDFYGVDSLEYSLTCGSNTTQARAYIIVNKPVSTSYVACYGSTVTAGFTAITDVAYYWYTTDVGGSPNPAEPANTRNFTSTTTQYVEARYKGKPVKPRLLVNVTIRSASLNNYPDIRVRVCPDAGVEINLSKYIDTLDLLLPVVWESLSGVPINSTTGVIPANKLVASRVYTFTYTASNPCVSDVKRKVYLETLNNGKMRPLKDVVVMCYEHAETVNINQLFGIDAGNGSWTYQSFTAGDVDNYVKKSPTTSPYSGAVVMDGKAIFNNIAAKPYHGVAEARQVTFTYTPATNSCLAGKLFTMTVVLTPNILN